MINCQRRSQLQVLNILLLLLLLLLFIYLFIVSHTVRDSKGNGKLSASGT